MVRVGGSRGQEREGGRERGGEGEKETYPRYVVMACIVMACVVMADIVMVYIAMAYVVMPCIVMAYMVMACIVMACIVMAYGFPSGQNLEQNMHSFKGESGVPL